MLPVSGIFVLGIVTILWRRRIRLPRRSIALGLAGLVLLCLGAGGLVLGWHGRANLVVMVDVSPSTRGAWYRDIQHLRQRMDQLLGDVPRRILWFSDHNREKPTGAMESARTIFSPPADADAVLLFSDGQFELPNLPPPVYAVVDPQLDSPVDAAVTGMAQHGEQVLINTTVRGDTRQLRVNHQSRMIAPPGQAVLAAVVEDAPVSARFEKGDAWPENDAMELRPPRESSQLWWVGDGVPAGWRQWSAEQLPMDAPAWLNPSVIVLNNIPARRLSDVQLRRLEQYIRDLGGALLVVGGDRSFAAGGYSGGRLDDLSPLASHPPQPTVHWILLADGSGSMNQPADGSTRWEIARAAMRAIMAQLPPQDLLSLGSFSNRLTWWSAGKTVRQTQWPDANPPPHGPTNLAAALEGLGKELADGLPKQVLLLTDGQAPPPDVDALIQLFKQADLRLFVLATGTGESIEALRQLAKETGGSVVEELDPARWVRSADQLLSTARHRPMEHTPVTMRWTGPTVWADTIVNSWNRVWLKPDADLWGSARLDGRSIPLSARWKFGLGEVTALAFAAPTADVAKLADALARPPTDPRWRIDWKTGPKLDLSIQSTGDPFINDANLQLHLGDAILPIPQTGPGRYRLTLDAPRRPTLAAVTMDGTVLDRRALAGMYAPEFAAIGNNLDNLGELAARSGGRRVAPAETRRLDLAGPARAIRLRGVCLLAGALLILSAGLGRRS